MKTIKIVMLDNIDRIDRCFCEADVIAGVLPNGFVRLLKNRDGSPKVMSKKNFLKYLMECCNSSVKDMLWLEAKKD